GPAMPGDGVLLLPDSGLGLRKYSEIAARSGLLVEATSHSTRKNAIIAVTKSAYATFHDPPWWARWAGFLALRTMTVGVFPLMAYLTDFRCCSNSMKAGRMSEGSVLRANSSAIFGL